MLILVNHIFLKNYLSDNKHIRCKNLTHYLAKFAFQNHAVLSLNEKTLYDILTKIILFIYAHNSPLKSAVTQRL